MIDRIVAVVARRARLHGADAEDFASDVRVHLMADDYAVLRKYEGRASLASFLSVVVQRLLCDERTRRFGRWHPSAEAERMGDAGVQLEKLISRDHRSLEEALPIVLAAHPSLSASDIEAIAKRLPVRVSRPRAIPIDDTPTDTFVAFDRADERALEADARVLAQRTSTTIRETLGAMSAEDRMILRFHFGSGMSLADVSRMMRLPQRPLYRRVDTMLERLRRACVTAGLDARSVRDLIGSTMHDMDFGFSSQSLQDEAFDASSS
ncbi:MAG TPA: hypothetical protein VMU84_07525 [Thermoanaerobaculia bacterium]|nr:hypothetical protein [Thermoanaerobaculia bacterium]